MFDFIPLDDEKRTLKIAAIKNLVNQATFGKFDSLYLKYKECFDTVLKLLYENCNLLDNKNIKSESIGNYSVTYCDCNDNNIKNILSMLDYCNGEYTEVRSPKPLKKNNCDDLNFNNCNNNNNNNFVFLELL